MPASLQSRRPKSQTPSAATKETPPTKTDILGTNTRATATHVFFWSGPLSNWHLGPKYPGHSALGVVVSELSRLNLQHPPTNTFTARLISEHMFNCGEQWMMVMKGWFFERDLELGNQIVGGEEEEDNDGMSEKVFQDLKAKMYRPKLPREWVEGSREQDMWESTVCKVLRTKKPRDQKALGRGARGFDESVWSAVNVTCVLAACVARAETDPVLRRMYLEYGDRAFVEGSPKDTIWGVGLHWQSDEIEDPNLWMGENRLGICHDRAAERVRDMFGKGGLEFAKNKQE